MIEVEFEFKVSGKNGAVDPYLDELELSMMFQHTRAQIDRQIQEKLGALRCAEHDQPPRVKITGIYSLETEQFDIEYHIDTCCKMFLLKAIQTLNA